jgi:hypothetical protein
MARSSTLYALVVTLGASSVLAQTPSSWARKVTLSEGDPYKPDDKVTLVLDLVNGTFERTEKGVTNTGRIVGTLRSRIDSILEKKEDFLVEGSVLERPGVQTIHRNEWKTSWDITIEGPPGPESGPSSLAADSWRAGDLHQTLWHVAHFTKNDWKVTGDPDKDDMTPYFGDAPRDWFPLEAVEGFRPDEDPASFVKEFGFERATVLLGLGFPFWTKPGEALATMAAYLDPDGYNRRAILETVHDYVRNNLYGDVTDSAIEERLAALGAPAVGSIRALREGEPAVGPQGEFAAYIRRRLAERAAERLAGEPGDMERANTHGALDVLRRAMDEADLSVEAGDP